MQVVSEVPAVWRQVAADHGMRDDCLLLLVRRQGAHQRQAGTLLILEQAGAGERSGIGIVGLGPEEAWREHHLPADDKTIEAQVMAEELPSPRFGFRRLTEQAKDIGPFAEHVRSAD